jgi:murein DD-endopeptidase MepM/ murein hydrolase activator NlpD
MVKNVRGYMMVGGVKWLLCDANDDSFSNYWVQDSQISATQTAVWPTPSYHGLSDSWGWRYNSYDGTIGFHRGIDIPAGFGTAVVAIMDGTVERRAEDSQFGKYIILKHVVPGKGTFYSYYFHLSVQSVSANNSVTADQKIGEVGMTGSATGYHLHFEFMRTFDRTNMTINTTNSYASKDTRSGTSPNPQPFYILSGSKYVFNSNFVWNYNENPLPSWYSHSSTYRK